MKSTPPKKLFVGGGGRLKLRNLLISNQGSALC